MQLNLSGSDLLQTKLKMISSMRRSAIQSSRIHSLNIQVNYSKICSDKNILVCCSVMCVLYNPTYLNVVYSPKSWICYVKRLLVGILRTLTSFFPVFFLYKIVGKRVIYSTINSWLSETRLQCSCLIQSINKTNKTLWNAYYILQPPTMKTQISGSNGNGNTTFSRRQETRNYNLREKKFAKISTFVKFFAKNFGKVARSSRN